MGRRASVGLRSLALVMALVMVTGCAVAPYRANPDLSRRFASIKTVVLLPPDVKVYQLTVGGTTELMDEWSAMGRRNTAEAVKRALVKEADVQIKDLEETDDPRLRETLDDIRALLDAVADTTAIHTYHPGLSIREKRENYRYSVGPLPELAEIAGGDALLFVSGVDYVSTAGRKAMMVLGAVVGAATGVVVMPRAGGARLRMMMVEAATGDVLWFNVAGSGAAELRELDSTASLATTLVTGFKTSTSTTRP